jgi:hypothetical protein
MNIEDLISEIEHFLINVQTKVDHWFDKPVDLRRFRPQNQGWTIDEILGHIALTSHFLLIIIEKGAVKALKNVQNKDLQVELQHYDFQRDRLNEIGIYKSFAWIRPAHMEPKGDKSLSEIRLTLKQQLQQCQNILDKLKYGEGVLYKTTMTVNQLGKIDVYEYLYFLGKHAERHIEQMRRNELEFCKRMGT